MLLSTALVLVLGTSATAVFAQSGSSIQQQEEQFIQEFALPKDPAKPPVYKPQPAPKQQSSPAPQRQSTPAPQRQSAPAPQQRSSGSSSPPPRQQNAAPQTTSRPSTSSSRAATQSQPSSAATNPSEDLPEDTYLLEFNRSPVVGNRLRLRGVYSETRLGFTRPRSWNPESVTAKAIIRFQHSPALIASRSSLTVRVNGRSVGSVPLNRQGSEVGNVVFGVPKGVIQDYNDLSIVAQQQNDPECSDPIDPTLWTEILPDSKLEFTFKPQPLPLTFNRYPYPFFDELSLDANRITYLLPKISEAWLTSAPRFQAALGRLANFRPVETRLVEDIDQVEWGERLVVIGTPADQPALKDLDLPFSVSGNQILDGNQLALPSDVGVLMLSTTLDGGVPVLVATGNGPEGVNKAVQFLVQPDVNKLGTGQAILVSQIDEVPTPSARDWPGYLPETKSFKLSEIETQANGEPFKDVTVRGAGAPPIEIDFRALPDDQFLRGSSMNLQYSYGPQINPRTSVVEVLLDGVFIGGARLTKEDGAQRETLKVDLPPNLITPQSKLEIAFRLNPREPGECGITTNDQLTGTLHADTSFNLNREISAQLPDLELFQSGFPFTTPQDLSSTAIVLPDSPSDGELLTLLAFSERLGRLSKSDSVKLETYTTDVLPLEINETHHLVGIGTWDKFPFPEVFDGGGFRLGNALSRQSNEGTIQTLPDEDGVIKEVVSSKNRRRVILALTARNSNGLERVRQILKRDPWFFQLQEDTAVISSNQQDPSGYDPNAYKLEFFEQAKSTTRLENTTPLSKARRFIQDNWLFLPTGILAIALLLYGVSQLYLKRFTDKKGETAS